MDKTYVGPEIEPSVDNDIDVFVSKSPRGKYYLRVNATNNDYSTSIDVEIEQFKKNARGSWQDLIKLMKIETAKWFDVLKNSNSQNEIDAAFETYRNVISAFCGGK